MNHNRHMILATVRNAGICTRVVACNIKHAGYTAIDARGVPEIELAAQRVACAVVNDFRGSTELNDCFTLRDPHALPNQRLLAGERHDLRNLVGEILMNLAKTNTIGWRALIDELASPHPAPVAVGR